MNKMPKNYDVIVARLKPDLNLSYFCGQVLGSIIRGDSGDYIKICHIDDWAYLHDVDATLDTFSYPNDDLRSSYYFWSAKGELKSEFAIKEIKRVAGGYAKEKEQETINSFNCLSKPSETKRGQSMKNKSLDEVRLCNGAYTPHFTEAMANNLKSFIDSMVGKDLDEIDVHFGDVSVTSDDDSYLSNKPVTGITIKVANHD